MKGPLSRPSRGRGGGGGGERAGRWGSVCVCYRRIKDAEGSLKLQKDIKWNLNSSNTDGSFIMDNSNSCFSPYEILPIFQVNKYLGKYFRSST